VFLGLISIHVRLEIKFQWNSTIGLKKKVQKKQIVHVLIRSRFWSFWEIAIFWALFSIICVFISLYKIFLMIKKWPFFSDSAYDTLNFWKFQKSTKKWKMDVLEKNHSINDHFPKKVLFLTFSHYKSSKKGSKNSRSSMCWSEVFVDFGHFEKLPFF